MSRGKFEAVKRAHEETIEMMRVRDNNPMLQALININGQLLDLIENLGDQYQKPVLNFVLDMKYDAQAKEYIREFVEKIKNKLGDKYEIIISHKGVDVKSNELPVINIHSGGDTEWKRLTEILSEYNSKQSTSIFNRNALDDQRVDFSKLSYSELTKYLNDHPDTDCKGE